MKVPSGGRGECKREQDTGALGRLPNWTLSLRFPHLLNRVHKRIWNFSSKFIDLVFKVDIKTLSTLFGAAETIELRL